MKKILQVISTFAGLALLASLAARAQGIEIPKLQARVNDLAGVLTAEQTAALEEKLRLFEDSDSTQIAILIIPSLEGESLEDYSIRVAEAWKLGQKGRDNGALLVIAMKERSIRIEVGYGLEPELTDARSRRIIDNVIVPFFRQGAFYQGVEGGVDAMIQTVRGVYQPSSAPSGRTGFGSGRGGGGNWIVFLAPLLWLLGSTGKWGGGILGSGAGLYLGHALYGFSLVPMLVGGLVGSILGVGLGALIGAAGRGNTRGPWGGFGGPFFPGGISRGGFRGGGFGGGGFSGGGGGFGGGGASGRW